MKWIEAFWWLAGKSGAIMVDAVSAPYLAATEIQRSYAETWVSAYRP